MEGNSLRNTESQQILLFANSANFGQLASLPSVHLERLAGTTPLARASAVPLFCPLASTPAFLHVGGELGREKYVVRFSRPRASDNSLEQSFSGSFCQELACQMFPVLFLPPFQLLSCPFLVFTFTVSFSCLGKVVPAVAEGGFIALRTGFALKRGLH